MFVWFCVSFWVFLVGLICGVGGVASVLGFLWLLVLLCWVLVGWVFWCVCGFWCCFAFGLVVFVGLWGALGWAVWVCR